MRFIIKTAFLLGLVAFFMSPRQGEGPDAASSFNLYQGLQGLQQAVADLSGFCERAPDACAMGQSVAIFAGDRISDGARLAYRMMRDGSGEERVVDPYMTSAIQSEPPAVDPIGKMIDAVDESPIVETPQIAPPTEYRRPIIAQQSAAIPASPATVPLMPKRIPVPQNPPRT
ncbi:DUF5330 domain-containing protein [Consotaella salsifontis]|uniref:DUF5330 domain-containing protein n=1 Tax=Consotaella salsifontis TaxID=1365950 RepID=A0A1T4MFU9_9HYPH|nr:DUF5330 domain-containing protein [Consotaella salsifontis]SJZ65802.1 hypothetical protein SAMN05428963_102104 [Consotaella salsifontis]